jgi:hypothetical protein
MWKSMMRSRRLPGGFVALPFGSWGFFAHPETAKMQYNPMMVEAVRRITLFLNIVNECA